MSAPMTATEKILAAHAGLDHVTPGQFVNAQVDLLLANDATAGKVIAQFQHIGADRVFDPERIVLVFDHYTPSNNIASATVCRQVREFAREAGGIDVVEVGKGGIEHCVLPERGLVLPGDLIVGQDSHTCTYGGLGAFATAVGVTDTAATMALGEIWLMVPETIRFELEGQVDPWTVGKDLILHTIGRIGVDGALYKAMEFAGSAVSDLSIDSRLSLCNMGIEAGAKNAMIPPDSTTEEYLRDRAGREYDNVLSEPDARYAALHRWDVTGLRPQVAQPFLPSNVTSIDEVDPVAIDQAVVGSCTNGRLEDLAQAAEILREHTVAQGTRLIVIPGSQEVYLEATRLGYIEIFVKAGGAVSTPTCGPCFGGHMGILAEDEVAVSTTNRNFVGRMGHPRSRVYLSNAAVAAASAVAGYLCAPEEVLS
ncbi:MAG: 3-isopropylmalate dehydratase large subunit [Thermoleophilia bacterium]|nr:3-isopropylmalate dehydratase large subunit [Thermoleophilia bacterium]